MTNPLLSCENLAVGYPTRPHPHVLLENLSLALHPHELVCFMGPNGIGKSTLLRTLAGLQNALSGKIARGDNKLAVVLTDKVAAATMTVFDLVSFGRYPYLDWTIRLGKHDEEIVNHSLEQVHIAHLAEKRLFELSDGQLQMAQIARALAQETPLLLLDEPTAHLDLNNRVEVMNLLLNLSRTTEKGILLATHELDLALQTADLIWLADSSKQITTGIPEDLVLNGSFDKVFQFKGFDLKSGKMQHAVTRKNAVGLSGEGSTLLWTKNALERSGYEVLNAGAGKFNIAVGENLTWMIGEKVFTSISDLLKELDH